MKLSLLRYANKMGSYVLVGYLMFGAFGANAQNTFDVSQELLDCTARNSALKHITDDYVTRGIPIPQSRINRINLAAQDLLGQTFNQATNSGVIETLQDHVADIYGDYFYRKEIRGELDATEWLMEASNDCWLNFATDPS